MLIHLTKLAKHFLSTLQFSIYIEMQVLCMAYWYNALSRKWIEAWLGITCGRYGMVLSPEWTSSDVFWVHIVIHRSGNPWIWSDVNIPRLDDHVNGMLMNSPFMADIVQALFNVDQKRCVVLMLMYIQNWKACMTLLATGSEVCD